MPKTISSNNLTVGATYLVRGKVGFSRITRQTTDEEREKENKRRMYPQNTNYSNISIYEAQVLAKNPQNPTIEERYAAECLYKSSSQNYPGPNFSAMNKSKKLPDVAEMRGPNNFVQIIPERELAQGLDVTLVMRVYKSGQRNNGVNLDKVLINGPVEYYGGNNDSNQVLQDWGINFQALPPKTDTKTADGISTAAAEAAAAADNDVSNFGAQSFGAMPDANMQQQQTQETPNTMFSSYGSAMNAAPANDAGANTPFGTFGPGAGRQY